jgi:thioredoxin 1
VTFVTELIAYPWRSLCKEKKQIMTIKLTTEEFINKVFNYDTDKEWNYKGTLPAIIDFYADWCGPCKMVAPILEELAKEYEGKIIICKVDTEAEQELSAVFGIRSIPSFLFIPASGLPMMQSGAFPKNVFKQVIEEKLLAAEKQES